MNNLLETKWYENENLVIGFKVLNEGLKGEIIGYKYGDLILRSEHHQDEEYVDPKECVLLSRSVESLTNEEWKEMEKRFQGDISKEIIDAFSNELDEWWQIN